jgi:hypothetical protein
MTFIISRSVDRGMDIYIHDPRAYYKIMLRLELRPFINIMKELDKNE